ncbi:succinate dehydrogenase assembly factor 2 [Roseococcus sp. SYP-B2431]|uniref:succinate dehydrogenase assembly factor 2 n=1 Tax=Roseococcus sp. SYP-B2431 TaxID=2496640 RepID=UPI001F0F5B42|nr:succinate dehydrogenase assembly factor 2 [Roseococcus sp. SYP-B2431]
MTIPDEAPGDAETLPPRQRRMLFRALHRGTKECDLMLGGFVRRNIADFSGPELAELERILEMPDVDLTDWLSGRRPVPEEARGPLLDRIISAAGEPGSGMPDEIR